MILTTEQLTATRTLIYDRIEWDAACHNHCDNAKFYVADALDDALDNGYTENVLELDGEQYVALRTYADDCIKTELGA